MDEVIVEQPRISRSIHPRVVGGRTEYDKVNTCGVWKGKGKLAKKQARLLIRRLAHSSTIKTPGIKAEAFRTPGSMK